MYRLPALAGLVLGYFPSCRTVLGLLRDRHAALGTHTPRPQTLGLDLGD